MCIRSNVAVELLADNEAMNCDRSTMIISSESITHIMILGLILICHPPCQGLVDVHTLGNKSAVWCSYSPVVTKLLPLLRLLLQAYFANGCFYAQCCNLHVPFAFTSDYLSHFQMARMLCRLAAGRAWGPAVLSRRMYRFHASFLCSWLVFP